jgi:hypothetical protein
MTRLFKVIGFEEGVNTCDCCGKSDLKGTFGIEMIETGEILYYGSVCVTRNTGYAKKDINAFAKADFKERVSAAQTEYRTHSTKADLHFKREQARAAGLGGIKFKDFCVAESNADDAVKKTLAAKYNVGFFDIF